MSKKTSGLGRGLGDLLADNAPEVRVSGTVVRNDGEKMTSVSNTEEDRKKAEQNDANLDEYLKISVYRTEESGVVAKTRERVEVSDLYAIRTESTENTEAAANEAQNSEPTPNEAPRPRSLKAVFRSFK